MKKWICAFLAALMLFPVGTLAESEQVTSLKSVMASAGMRYLTVMGSGIAGLAPINGRECLVVHGFDGRQNFVKPVAEIMPEGMWPDGLAACTEDGEGGLFALFAVDDTTEEPKTYLVHLSGSGECLWSSLFVQQVNWGWVHLAPDGLGGVYLVHASMDDYTTSVIRRFSDSGEIVWKKLLRMDGLVWQPYAALSAAKNGLRVYGTAVSVSEGVYRALALDVSAEGVVGQIDTRDFAFWPDETAKLVYDPVEGRVRFVSMENDLDETATKKVDMPFGSLDKCPDPDCSLEDADMSVH